ncbi:MAG: hypothetical protein KY451_15315 [Actinobacteria bacterium]|nr:hypothetical protein [Actinomycetota bacterium]
MTSPKVPGTADWKASRPAPSCQNWVRDSRSAHVVAVDVDLVGDVAGDADDDRLAEGNADPRLDPRHLTAGDAYVEDPRGGRGRAG